MMAGPQLGGGPVWRLRAGEGASDGDKDGNESLYRCGTMLEQALSCSAFADVRFVFDDGESGVRGHRGMLCSVSQEFCGMFESEMAEAKSGEVRVRGVSRESFRGFLELLYLGECVGEEMRLIVDLWGVQRALGRGVVCACLMSTLFMKA